MTTRPDLFSEAKEIARLDDPAVSSRCVKLKRRSNFQTTLLVTILLGLVASFILLVHGYTGTTTRRGLYHPPIPGLIPYGMAVVVIALASLVSYCGCRNYYLLDPVLHRLYHHFSLFWYRRRQIVFREGEVFCITVEGRKQSSKRGYYWVYRLTCIGMNGQSEPLSDWRRDGLEEWNSKALDLAGLLDCQSIVAPPKSTLSVELGDEVPALTFIPG